MQHDLGEVPDFVLTRKLKSKEGRSIDYAVYNPWAWDATAQQQNDPLWGIQDPAAGDWFGTEALQLAGH